VVRAQEKALLEDFLRGGGCAERQRSQVHKRELPLSFFSDSMIAESTLPFASQWNESRLAYEGNELAGDEKFFDLLDETLKDSSEEASERLAVYYSCLGLGFTGIFFNQPEYLRKSLLTIAPRIRHLMDTEQSGRICPEAYEGVDSRDLIQPPSSRVALLGIVFACFIIAVLASYFLMYQKEKSRIANSMMEIVVKDLNGNPN
jgi:type VI protein secretion system component VasF